MSSHQARFKWQEVPFGRRIVNGFVLAVKKSSELDNLKDIKDLKFKIDEVTEFTIARPRG